MSDSLGIKRKHFKHPVISGNLENDLYPVGITSNSKKLSFKWMSEIFCLMGPDEIYSKFENAEDTVNNSFYFLPEKRRK